MHISVISLILLCIALFFKYKQFENKYKDLLNCVLSEYSFTSTRTQLKSCLETNQNLTIYKLRSDKYVAKINDLFLNFTSSSFYYITEVYNTNYIISGEEDLKKFIRNFKYYCLLNYNKDFSIKYIGLDDEEFKIPK